MKDEKSLGDDATFAGAAKRRAASEMSLGDERTLGDRLGDQDTVIDDIEIVDLEARYKVEGTLGQGGMGAVLLATDTRLDRKVAIKRILGEAAGNRMAVQRFLTEAKAIAALNHPNVVQIYDYGRAKDGPFLIMEYVDGGSLLDRCRESPLPLDEAIDLACQLCDGLAKAHDLGIIHRDIKPANVLLTQDGIPKLTDFGLAKAQAGDHGQTMTGAVLGTPDFMPPEQRRDASEVDARSDLWSLAATIYQMVTGRSPKVIRLHELPQAFQGVMARALEEAKEARYQSARELRDSLKAGLRSLATVTAATSRVAGQCPACGVPNDSTRKFCRGCGEVLEVACLGCNAPTPVWEEVCGTCGVRQTEAAAVRLGEAHAEEARAEGLLADLEFAKAEELTRQLGSHKHPALASVREWSTTFLPKIDQSRSKSLRQAADELSVALRAEAESDYLSALFTLEMVPRPLHELRLPDATETIAAAISRLKIKQSESVRLDRILKDRLSAKEFDDLLPVVEKLITLHPQRTDLSKLRTQLAERQIKRANAKAETLKIARERLNAHDYDGASTLLAKLVGNDSPEIAELRKRAADNARKAKELATKIRAALAAKQYEGLLQTVKDYLVLKPNDVEFQRLLRPLQDREHKIAAEVNGIAMLAEQLRKQCEFGKAAATLLRIPEPRRTPTIAQTIARCQLLAEARNSILRAAEDRSQESTGIVLEKAYDYCQQLQSLGIQDQEIASLVAGIKNARERARIAQAGWQYGQAVIATIVLFTALVGGLLGLWRFGSWSSGQWRSGEIENGIGMRLVPIEPGELRRRDTLRTSDGNVHHRTAKRAMEAAYRIGSTEVTQQEWHDVMTTRPWDGQPNAVSDPRQPATYIARVDAQEFCRKLTERERERGAISNEEEYRLPTCWEWEYASSAGAMTSYHFGENQDDIAAYEWCATSSEGKQRDHPSNVGLKRPNRWGLFDAFGNVLEICSDGVLGACWTDPPSACTLKQGASSRSTDEQSCHTGFRVVLGTVKK